LGLTEDNRKSYVCHLASILSDGFWLNIPKEQIEGNNKSWIEYKAPMICFTEIRLSNARLHSERYGLLGIGVTRRFVLDRFGGPVHYMRNNRDECIIGNVHEIREYLDQHDPQIAKYFAVNCAFLKSMSRTSPKTSVFS